MEQLNQTTLNFIYDMLLLQKITLSDIPFEIRNTSTNFYVIACRVSRNASIEKYNNDLELLCEDIKRMHSYEKYVFLKLYNRLSENIEYIEMDNKNEKVYKQIFPT